MRAPAIVIAASFAGGIALGNLFKEQTLLALSFILRGSFLFALLLAALGLLLARKQKYWSAQCVTGLIWCVLGIVAAVLALRPAPPNHVISLIETGRLSLADPLEWRGQLMEEPRRLPWGTRLEVALRSVSFEEQTIAAQGGLRLSYVPTSALPENLPELHAGDEVAVTTRARIPSNFRDDGAFDRRLALQRQGFDLVANLRAPELIQRVSPGAHNAHTLAARLRERLRNKLDELFTGRAETAGILRAMLLGDRSFVDAAESKSFQITGTYHVLVVAGLHVTALAIFLYWLGRMFRLSRWSVSLLTLVLLAGYVSVVEQRPPVLRAALMAGIVVVGRMLFRRLDLLNSAAVAASLLLIARPLELFDPSFQLSFLAIGCIGGIAAPWLEQSLQPYATALRGWRDVTRDLTHAPTQAQFRIDLRGAAKWLEDRLSVRTAHWTSIAGVATLAFLIRAGEILVLSFVLQLGMMPLMAQQFHRIALSGPLANSIAVPLTGVVVPAGFLLLGVSFAFTAIAQRLALLLVWLVNFLLYTTTLFARLPGSSYRIPAAPQWLGVLFFAALLGVSWCLRAGARAGIRVFAALALICGAIVAVHPFQSSFAGGKLEITALDVAQGDSLLVVSPHGKTLLIDSGGAFGGFRPQNNFEGPDPGEEAVSPYLWSRGFKSLDVVALTHAHQDHIGGLKAILENFHVTELWIGREVNSATLVALEELARRRNVKIVHRRRGDEFDWDGVKIQVLWPEIAPEEIAPSAKNNDSLVLRLQYGQRTALLPGDIEKQAESQILSDSPEESLRADILKIGHHGSRNSSTEEFLAQVAPEIAVISAGADNPYGHPSEEVLQRLEFAGIRTLRTDRSGAIHFYTDGKRVEVYCYLDCGKTETANESRKAPRPQQGENPDQQ